MDRSFLTVLAIVAVACGGASSGSTAKEPAPATSSSAATAPPAPQPAEAPPESVDPDAVPQKCAEGQADGICAPPKAFVKTLCGTYPKPDIALIMFAKSSPFTRVYMNRNMEGWYTSGQQSTSAKLIFDEEVVVLGHAKASTGGMVIGNGATPYDILRIDGVCSSVETEAITTRRPPKPKYAIIPWQRLEKNVRDSLISDPGIAAAEAARRKECKGTTSLGVLSPTCARADDRLSMAVVDYIKNGGQPPMPKPAR